MKLDFTMNSAACMSCVWGLFTVLNIYIYIYIKTRQHTKTSSLLQDTTQVRHNNQLLLLFVHSFSHQPSTSSQRSLSSTCIDRPETETIHIHTLLASAPIQHPDIRRREQPALTHIRPMSPVLRDVLTLPDLGSLGKQQLIICSRRWIPRPDRRAPHSHSPTRWEGRVQNHAGGCRWGHIHDIHSHELAM